MTLAMREGDELRALRAKLPAGLEMERDEDELRIFARRDMLHLDADALHDRLHHWTLTALERELPAARAYVSFRHASPSDPESEPTLDAQEAWLALEPTLALELRAAKEGDEERLAALAPRFMELVEKSGRPAGFRRPDVGTME